MTRYKKENRNSYHKSECIRCGGEATRRNSFAVILDPKEAAKLVLARDKNKRPVTRKAGPRIHRHNCKGDK